MMNIMIVILVKIKGNNGKRDYTTYIQESYYT